MIFIMTKVSSSKNAKQGMFCYFYKLPMILSAKMAKIIKYRNTVGQNVVYDESRSKKLGS
jgi:hypothetical protein